jgi:hypothetical protein
MENIIPSVRTGSATGRQTLAAKELPTRETGVIPLRLKGQSHKKVGEMRV